MKSGRFSDSQKVVLQTKRPKPGWLTALLMLGLIGFSATVATVSTMSIDQAQAQEDDLDSLFEEDFEAPPFEPPPPPQPPPQTDNPPLGSGVPPIDNSVPPPPFPNNVPRPNTNNRPQGTPRVQAPPNTGDVKSRFAQTPIEEVNNQNFPETIESFDFPNADIKDVIKAISELTGKNFIIDPNVSGRVTIMAPSKITVAEAYRAFLSSLAGLGFTVVPSGKFLKIKSARNAQRDSIETYSGPYSPDADVLITRIVQLKHTSADEINKRLRVMLPSKDGDMVPYEPTNSLIITDFGSNVERIMRIITEIDKPGFEETLEVIPIKYAKAKEMADMLNQIINKEPGGAGAAGGFRAGVPRFRSRGAGVNTGTPEELSLVAPDERTNAIIVLGTKSGIAKVKEVVRKLDYKLDPSEAGGVFVYYVKHGEAEKIAAVLQGVAQASGGGAGSGGAGGGSSAPATGLGTISANRPFVNPAERQAIFGGDVRITADKTTNSLVIVASKQDYETVKSILNRIDAPRDQVFVEVVIMELSTNKVRDWNPAVYYFPDDGTGTSTGAGRMGYSRSGTLANILNPTADAGAILSFGGNKKIKLRLGNQQEITIPNLIGFINFLQTNVEGNVLSKPQILALDNEEATVEVGDEIPVGQAQSVTGTGIQNFTPQFKEATIKLTLTPFISPDTDKVRMKLKQTVKQLGDQPLTSGGNTIPSFVTRAIDSNIVVSSGDTAVLGGLMRENDRIRETKVPLLGDVPVLGWLFKSSQRQRDKTNLLVFLTPKVIRSTVDSQNLLSQKKAERVEWVKQNFDGRDPYGKIVEQLPQRADASDDEGFRRSSDEAIRAPNSVSPSKKSRSLNKRKVTK